MVLNRVKTILFVGINGPIDDDCLEQLIQQTGYQVIALTRNIQNSVHTQFKWINYDLFSLDEPDLAINNGDIVVYFPLIFFPTARLDQGNLDDYNLILADHFARIVEQKSNNLHIYFADPRVSNEEIITIFNNYSLNILNVQPNKIINGPDSLIAAITKFLKGVTQYSQNNSFSRNVVRSIQRFSIPTGWNAQRIAQEYFQWLPKFFWPFIFVYECKKNWQQIEFCFLHHRFVLLRLIKWHHQNEANQAIFIITGGLLVQALPLKGRLEFDVIFPNEVGVSAVHDFCPKLPWFIYRISQALVHVFVMKSFAKHLLKIKKGKLIYE